MKISKQALGIAASVTAVVGIGVGGGMAAFASGSGPAAPKQPPAGQIAVATTPELSVSTSSAVTSPSPAVVSSSVVKASPKTRAVVKENVMTEPSPTDAPTAPSTADPSTDVPNMGITDGAGIRRAHPTVVIKQHPSYGDPVPPPLPVPSDSPN